MSAYIVKSTREYPIHFGDIVIRYPDATEENIPEDIALVLETSKPSISDGQGVYETSPIEIDSSWVQQWIVRTLTQEEIDNLNTRSQSILDKINEANDG